MLNSAAAKATKRPVTIKSRQSKSKRNTMMLRYLTTILFAAAITTGGALLPNLAEIDLVSSSAFAQTDGMDRRDDRQDSRQDCRQAEGAGKDKRDCKQENR
jgi:hypothetical protein